MTTTNNELYLNNHGNELVSIMSALEGILLRARSCGAVNISCDEVHSEILWRILETPRKGIKDMLQNGNFKVLIDGGFLDVGYELSLRF